MRNVWTTPSVWFYILYSHIYFLFIAFHLYRLHTKCIESRVHSLFYFTFTRSILASVWAICMHIILYCFAWRTASLWTQKQVKSNKPVSVICFMFGHFLMFDWINLMHSARNWLTIVFNLQFSVISRAIIIYPKLLHLVLHLLIVNTMEALGCHKIGPIDIYFWLLSFWPNERKRIGSKKLYSKNNSKVCRQIQYGVLGHCMKTNVNIQKFQ